MSEAGSKLPITIIAENVQKVLINTRKIFFLIYIRNLYLQHRIKVWYFFLKMLEKTPSSLAFLHIYKNPMYTFHKSKLFKKNLQWVPCGIGVCGVTHLQEIWHLQFEYAKYHSTFYGLHCCRQMRATTVCNTASSSLLDWQATGNMTQKYEIFHMSHTS